VRLTGGEAEGVLLFTTRLLYPPGNGAGARELTLEQFLRNGRLEQLHASLTEGGRRLEHDGLWTANSWRMQTRLDGQIVNTPAPLREQPVCVDAGSITALLILGQVPVAESLPVVELHPGFDAEPVHWRLELDAEGNHLVRTQLGVKAFRLDEHGALEYALTRMGAGAFETHSLASTTFGGPGLPLPAEKVRAAAAKATAEAGTTKGGG
jgi:hypothetical protein